MKDQSISPSEYKDWILGLKSKIQSAQIKAALTVNTQLIHLYYYLGEQLYKKQQMAQWGDKILIQVSKDLKTTFPEMKGFSVTNLKYIRAFYQFYLEKPIGQQPVAQSAELQLQKTDFVISQQAVDQIPWGHNILIFTKSKDLKEAEFYIKSTLQNHWSRDVLALQSIV